MAVSVQLAAIADAANISREGKLNLIGEFNLIWAQQEPVLWPSLVYVAKVCCTEEDGRKLDLHLRVVDEDEGLIAELGMSIAFSAPTIEGVGSAVPIVIPIVGATFPKYGSYYFVLSVRGGPELARTPLHIGDSSRRPGAGK